MKRIVLLSALVLVLGLSAAPAFARHGAFGGGFGNCPAWSADTPEQQKFLDETASLRKQMVQDRAELEAVMNSANPDPKRARELAASIYDTRAAIQAKAQALGIKSAPCAGQNAGNCPGGGPGGGGRGPGGCGRY